MPCPAAPFPAVDPRLRSVVHHLAAESEGRQDDPVRRRFDGARGAGGRLHAAATHQDEPERHGEREQERSRHGAAGEVRPGMAGGMRPGVGDEARSDAA